MKLYYYKKNKRFHCYTDCGDNFNIFTLFERRYKLLNKQYNFYTDIVQKINGGLIAQTNLNGFNMTYKSDFDKYNINKPKVNLKILNPSILDIYSFYATPEWLADGISEETMRQYQIRFSTRENKIIIPHYNEEGYLIGIRGRALNPDEIEIGKYMPVFIEGEIKAHPLGYNLYGLNFIKGNIKKFKMGIIAESEKSALQYNTMFGHSNNICVASCGSSVSEYQINLLIAAGAQRILIAFDKEGKDWQEQQEYYKKRKNLCKRFSNKCKMGFIWDSSDLLELKDSPTDKGKEIFEKLYRGAIWL